MEDQKYTYNSLGKKADSAKQYALGSSAGMDITPMYTGKGSMGPKSPQTAGSGGSVGVPASGLSAPAPAHAGGKDKEHPNAPHALGCEDTETCPPK